LRKRTHSQTKVVPIPVAPSSTVVKRPTIALRERQDTSQSVIHNRSAAKMASRR